MKCEQCGSETIARVEHLGYARDYALMTNRSVWLYECGQCEHKWVQAEQD